LLDVHQSLFIHHSPLLYPTMLTSKEASPSGMMNWPPRRPTKLSSCLGEVSLEDALFHLAKVRTLGHVPRAFLGTAYIVAQSDSQVNSMGHRQAQSDKVKLHVQQIGTWSDS
jgi:hypothetical protein